MVSDKETIKMLQEIIVQLQEQNAEHLQTITTLNSTIANLQNTIANLNETIDELRRKIFGKSREKFSEQETPDSSEEVTTVEVKAHTRAKHPKGLHDDLYSSLEVKEVRIDAVGSERICPDCGAEMKHLGYREVREELRIIPAKILRIKYFQETLQCPVCRSEDITTITAAKSPTALLAHSPASPSMVAEIMYNKSFMHMPFYRQEKHWQQMGFPLPRETAANWYNKCSITYFKPLYERLHSELLRRGIIHADETTCQVLHEEDRAPESTSYIWIYTSGSDGEPKIVLMDYKSGRGHEYPQEFLKGYKGIVQCDGYAAYGCLEDVTLACCLAHCRRKFFEAIPVNRRKKLKLLDINSEENIPIPVTGFIEDSTVTPAEKGVLFCNRFFILEREYKKLTSDERKTRREAEHPKLWTEFWNWLETLKPAGGSKLEKAVNYALNHKETLMTYIHDGRCEISNNAAERVAKTYATGRKNFLFHDTVAGAEASAIVMSLIETAKQNGLNVYQYLYMLLLYLPDYNDEPEGIEQLLPWSEFIKEHCSGAVDTENICPENKPALPILDKTNV